MKLNDIVLFYFTCQSCSENSVVFKAGAAAVSFFAKNFYLTRMRSKKIARDGKNLLCGGESKVFGAKGVRFFVQHITAI